MVQALDISYLSISELGYHATDLAELPDKYPPQLEHRLKAGGHFFASEYVQSQRVRSMVVAQVRELFGSIDLMLCPTMRGEAPTYAESLGDMWVRRPGLTSLFNFAGLPALDFPIGFSEHELPLSGQLVGRPFRRGDGAAGGACVSGDDRLAPASSRDVGEASAALAEAVGNAANLAVPGPYGRRHLCPTRRAEAAGIRQGACEPGRARAPALPEGTRGAMRCT